MGEDTVAVLIGKMEEISRMLGAISSRLEHFTEEMARHQEEIASLSECVTSIRLERAKERGYLLGALAGGSIIGWLAEKFIGL
jgi:hypothetical protein